jgi:hypothetical protein
VLGAFLHTRSMLACEGYVELKPSNLSQRSTNLIGQLWCPICLSDQGPQKLTEYLCYPICFLGLAIKLESTTYYLAWYFGLRPTMFGGSLVQSNGTTLFVFMQLWLLHGLIRQQCWPDNLLYGHFLLLFMVLSNCMKHEYELFPTLA